MAPPKVPLFQKGGAMSQKGGAMSQKGGAMSLKRARGTHEVKNFRSLEAGLVWLGGFTFW
jgi:hypothetical protein